MRTFERRRWIAGAAAGLIGLFERRAEAFGDSGVFHPRALTLAGRSAPADLLSALERYAFEVAARTSAPSRTKAEAVGVDQKRLLFEPFVVWSGSEDPGVLSRSGVERLREFLALGGLLVVDEREPERGELYRGVRRELARVLPEAAPVVLSKDHVLYKSFYLVDRPVGRVVGPETAEAILQGKAVSVLFLRHDLVGALATEGETWRYAVESGEPKQRERAIRFAVNIALYALCSDYKDDQVHAPYLMRRRLRR